LLPTRVVDISGKPTVVVTNATRAEYIALSYCWGPSNSNLLLTQETLLEYQTCGIDMDRLPKTIRDAILVTKKLGLNYIWIDALCIIQREDDLKDFIAEASSMAEYYSNAYLTVVAGLAADCANGFLNSRSPSKAAPCEIPYNRPETQDSSEEQNLGSIYLCLPTSVAIGPTTTRAWTLQETELSRRVLIFGQDQFSFKCQKLEFLENGDWIRTAQNSANWSAIDIKLPSLYSIASTGDGDIDAYMYRRWRFYLSQYSRRSMTNPQDKFAALAGLAKRVKQYVRSKYMFGIWERDLVRELLWTAFPKMGRMDPLKRAVIHAPSWSWAGVDGAITVDNSARLDSWYTPPVFDQARAGSCSAQGERSLAQTVTG
jgi:Heterokaryon incompatibility protein (HET)